MLNRVIIDNNNFINIVNEVIKQFGTKLQEV